MKTTRQKPIDASQSRPDGRSPSGDLVPIVCGCLLLLFIATAITIHFQIAPVEAALVTDAALDATPPAYADAARRTPK